MTKFKLNDHVRIIGIPKVRSVVEIRLNHGSETLYRTQLGTDPSSRMLAYESELELVVPVPNPARAGLTEATVGRLPMGPPDLAEHRRSLRVREPIPVRYAIASEHYRVEHETTTMDRSPSGFKIRTAAPLSCGETVLVLSLGGKRSAIPTRVAWVRGAEFSFAGAAGLEILNSLPR